MMDEGTAPRGAATERAKPRRRGLVGDRPDRIALWAFALAVIAMVAAAATAHAGSGGVGAGGGTGTGSANDARYSQIWDGFAQRDKRWAHRTSQCESGGNPKAIGGHGAYRGAFQFTRPTWKSAPRSPGGDPIQHPWRTQAVVAVSLKHREGTRPWPVCG